MENIKNLNGDDIVIIENEDGSTWSGLKSAYDAMQAEQSTPNLAGDEAKTK